MSTDVVGRLAVVGALGQPLADRVAVSGGVVVAAASEAGRTESRVFQTSSQFHCYPVVDYSYGVSVSLTITRLFRMDNQ